MLECQVTIHANRSVSMSYVRMSRNIHVLLNLRDFEREYIDHCMVQCNIEEPYEIESSLCGYFRRIQQVYFASKDNIGQRKREQEFLMSIKDK